MGWIYVLFSGRGTRQTALKGKAAYPVCNSMGNTNLRKNPALWRHSQASAWDSRPFLNRMLPSILDVITRRVFAGFYTIRRCLEHLLEGCSGSCPGDFHSNCPAALPRRALKAWEAQEPHSSLSLGLPEVEIVPWWWSLLLQLFVHLASNNPQRKKAGRPHC